MQQRRSLTNFGISLLLSIIAFCIVMSYKGYFIFTPFQQGVNILSFLQFLTIVGWVLLVFAPPLFFFGNENWSPVKLYAFYGSVWLWTGAVTGIKLHTLITVGQVFIDYLISIPILFFFEWLLPTVYTLIARNQFNTIDYLDDGDNFEELDDNVTDSKLL